MFPVKVLERRRFVKKASFERLAQRVLMEKPFYLFLAFGFVTGKQVTMRRDNGGKECIVAEHSLGTGGEEAVAVRPQRGGWTGWAGRLLSRGKRSEGRENAVSGFLFPAPTPCISPSLLCWIPHFNSTLPKSYSCPASRFHLGGSLAGWLPI